MAFDISVSLPFVHLLQAKVKPSRYSYQSLPASNMPITRSIGMNGETKHCKKQNMKINLY